MAAGNGGQKMSQYLWFTVYFFCFGKRRFCTEKGSKKIKDTGFYLCKFVA